MTNLTDGDIELRLEKDVAADTARDWLRALHYNIVLKGTGVVVGRIDLRLGYAYDVEHFGGHFGYYIEPASRGHHYAGRACRLLRSVALAHGMDVLWITCNPENDASRKTWRGWVPN